MEVLKLRDTIFNTLETIIIYLRIFRVEPVYIIVVARSGSDRQKCHPMSIMYKHDLNDIRDKIITNKLSLYETIEIRNIRKN